jgi:hypothetical protein
MYKCAQNISSVLGGGCVYVAHYSSLFQYLIYFSKGFLAASWTVALACLKKLIQSSFMTF